MTIFFSQVSLYHIKFKSRYCDQWPWYFKFLNWRTQYGMDSKAQCTPCINMKSTGNIATSQLQRPQFDPELSLLSVWSYMFSQCPCGFQTGRIIDSSKFPLGVCVCVCTWYPAIDWHPTQGVFPPHAQHSPDPLTRIKQLLKMKELTCSLHLISLLYLPLIFIYIGGLNDYARFLAV